LANTPKGRQVIGQATAKAQQLASDPRTRARIDEARRRFQGGRGPGSGH
jgi:conjugal transfer/entry exclusion protein